VTPCRVSLHLRHLDASAAKWQRVVLMKSTVYYKDVNSAG